MKQYTNNYIRFAEVLTHVIGWGIVFGFPFFIINRGGEAIDWMGYLRHSGVSLSFFIVFYLNYFLLIPRYLFSGRIREYMLLNLALIILMSGGLHLWQILHRKLPVKICLLVGFSLFGICSQWYLPSDCPQQSK